MIHNWIQIFTTDDNIPNEFKRTDYQCLNCHIEFNHYYATDLSLNLPKCEQSEVLITNHQFKLVSLTTKSQTFQCLNCQSKFSDYQGIKIVPKECLNLTRNYLGQYCDF